PAASAPPDPAASSANTDHRDDDGKYQDCNDPSQWPFEALATQVAAERPDLVVHVGDYLYREAQCPVGASGGAKSPWGDTWLTWAADFFRPGRKLLEAAPWIVVRGTHELCSRNGMGYAILLDPRLSSEQPPRCDPTLPKKDQDLPPYTVR